MSPIQGGFLACFVLSFLVGLFGIKNSFAYDPHIHAEITRVAAEQSGGALSPTEVDWLSRGALREDTRGLGKRMRNWHFFPRDYYPEGSSYRARDPIDYWGQIHFTAHHMMDRIQLDLTSGFEGWVFSLWRFLIHQENSVKNRLLNRVGAALHYIQDATVPGHVVPIYHGPNIQFLGFGTEVSLGFRLKLSDPIDVAPMTEFAPDELTNHMHGEVVAPEMSNFIRENIAQVLEELTHPIDPLDENLAGLTWGYFFQSPTENRFFGSYRVGANGRQLFDPHSSLAFVELGDRPPYEVSPILVRGFIRRLHGLAVTSSIKYLRSQLPLIQLLSNLPG